MSGSLLAFGSLWKRLKKGVDELVRWEASWSWVAVSRIPQNFAKTREFTHRQITVRRSCSALWRICICWNIIQYGCAAIQRRPVLVRSVTAFVQLWKCRLCPSNSCRLLTYSCQGCEQRTLWLACFLLSRCSSHWKTGSFCSRNTVRGTSCPWPMSPLLVLCKHFQ